MLMFPLSDFPGSGSEALCTVPSAAPDVALVLPFYKWWSEGPGKFNLHKVKHSINGWFEWFSMSHRSEKEK